jgi:hypothetical protein
MLLSTSGVMGVRTFGAGLGVQHLLIIFGLAVIFDVLGYFYFCLVLDQREWATYVTTKIPFSSFILPYLNAIIIIEVI